MRSEALPVRRRPAPAPAGADSKRPGPAGSRADPPGKRTRAPGRAPFVERAPGPSAALRLAVDQLGQAHLLTVARRGCLENRSGATGAACRARAGGGVGAGSSRPPHRGDRWRGRKPFHARTRRRYRSHTTHTNRARRSSRPGSARTVSVETTASTVPPRHLKTPDFGSAPRWAFRLPPRLVDGFGLKGRPYSRWRDSPRNAGPPVRWRRIWQRVRQPDRDGGCPDQTL